MSYIGTHLSEVSSQPQFHFPVALLGRILRKKISDSFKDIKFISGRNQKDSN